MPMADNNTQCQGACFGQHKRSMEILIEVYAEQCTDVQDYLDTCICNIESLIAQKQCMFTCLGRLTYTGTQTPDHFADRSETDRAYTVMRYEAEYTFNPATCQFVVPKCRR